MRIKYLFYCFCLVGLSACTSSTKSVVNPVVNTAPVISKTLAQENEKSLKRVVAIGRFSDETKRGNSFLVDENNNRIGKQASDILSARLTDSGKFIMLERTDFNALAKENQLNGDALNAIGADFMILGSVSEYGRSSTSDIGIFSRNKKQKAYVTVNVRLVNTKTSEVVFSQEATGEAVIEASNTFGVGESAGYDASLDDKALSAAISKLTSNIMENLLDAPWQAYLLSAEGNQFFMSGGEAQGLKLADKFQVLAKGKMVKNPQTGQMIELPGKKVAVIEVDAFAGKGANAISITSIQSGKIDATKLTNYIVREL